MVRPICTERRRGSQLRTITQRILDDSHSVRRRSSHGRRLEKSIDFSAGHSTTFSALLTDDMHTSVVRFSGTWEAAEREQDALRHGLLSCASQIDCLGRVVRPECKIQLSGVRCCGYQVAV